MELIRAIRAAAHRSQIVFISRRDSDGVLTPVISTTTAAESGDIKIPADPQAVATLDLNQWEELAGREVMRLTRKFPMPGELHEIALELRR
jgi:hypothetical protein